MVFLSSLFSLVRQFVIQPDLGLISLQCIMHNGDIL